VGNQKNFCVCPQWLYGAYVFVKMMPLIKLNSTDDTAVSRITDALRDNSLRVMMSFDSQLTRTSTTPAACPHHGTAACDCQIVILLVYDKDSQPATLLAHGQDGETWISLVVAPGQRPHADLESKIKRALSPLPEIETGTLN
jgi:hypothetical protein